MKELNIGKCIALKRKEKGITQEDLANYIGVSKASVSKWETGQSYPDIVFLPEIATYFNISVDELIGYSPQMTKEEIKKLYKKLSLDFTKKDFEEVYKECREIIKKYYSCFPLLYEMVLLILNHYMLEKDKAKQEKVLLELVELCNHIKKDGDNISFIKNTNSIEAIVELTLNNPEKALVLLEGELKPSINNEPLIANAYELLGNHEKAVSVLQFSAYNSLMGLLNNMLYLIKNYYNDKDNFNETVNRILQVFEIFKVRNLDENIVLLVYLEIAQGYLIQGNKDSAFKYLFQYLEVCRKFKDHIYFHGDDYFCHLEEIFKELEINVEAPRDKKIIIESMISAISENPLFQSLKEEPKYRILLEELNTLKEE